MKKIAFFSYDLRIGGAEKMVVTLLPCFAEAGYAVDLVLVNASGPLLQEVDSRVTIVNFRKTHTTQSLFPLINYLKDKKPDVLISNLTHLNNIAILAQRLSRTPTALIVTEHSTISLNNLAKGGKEWLLVQYSRLLYPLADRIIAVSAGAAENLQKTLRVASAKVGVIHNPIDLAAIRRLKEEPAEDPWLADQSIPVLLSVGRLAREKNYPFLLEVFHQVLQTRSARLIILGEGYERPVLEQKIRDLDLQNAVRLPGATLNPYPFMKRANIVLCTSDYEGFNIALAEALACGTPVISVDCPHGPAEILDHGKYGTLIPLGRKDRMVEAILSELDKPANLAAREILVQRAAFFSVDKVFMDYDQMIAGVIQGREKKKVSS